MITTTSSSECGRFWGLYRSTLRRNRGYFSLLCALMAFFYPVQYLLEVAAPPSRTTALFSDPMDYYTLLGLGKNYTFLSAVFFTGLMLAAPLILGLLLHGYMRLPCPAGEPGAAFGGERRRGHDHDRHPGGGLRSGHLGGPSLSIWL